MQIMGVFRIDDKYINSKKYNTYNDHPLQHPPPEVHRRWLRGGLRVHPGPRGTI